MTVVQSSRALALGFARALFVENQFSLYRGDGTNQLRSGWVSAEQAVRSGEAYLGRTRPHIWGIDVDDPSHRAFPELLTFLDLAGLEFFEVDSGNRERPGRHVYVHVPDDPDRAVDHRRAIREALESRFGRLLGVIDFREQQGGGALRPPFSPHRNGATIAVPVEDDHEALLERVLGWADHRLLPGDLFYENERTLAAWVEPWLAHDKARARAIGRPLPLKLDGSPDRSRIDCSLALAFRNAGRTEDDWLRTRGPSGSRPSARAVEEGPNWVGYLKDKWQWALGQPLPFDNLRIGLDRLDEFEAEIGRFDGFARPKSMRTLLAAFIKKAKELGKVQFDLSRLEIRDMTGHHEETIHKNIHDPAFRRFVELVGSRTEIYHSQTYRLRVLETTEPSSRLEVQGSDNTLKCGGDLPVLSTPCTKLPDRAHPLFWNRPAALKPTGYATLRCFSFSEPRTQAEAMRLRAPDDVGKRTFKERHKELRQLGILEADGTGKRYTISRTVDWDQLADQLGLTEAQAKIGAIAATRRAGFRQYLLRRNDTSDEVREQLERTGAVPLAGRLVDTETGEILNASVAPTLPAAPRSAPRTRPCRCCGLPATSIEPITGLPWHKRCRMPAWVAKIEERHGIKIPEELIQRPTKVVVDDSEWFTGPPPTICGDHRRTRAAA
jgi:catechol 2,3-dioxygenase-like lactoylglutathione lyase family enzyme